MDLNKRKRKPKEQWRMDNPETLTTLGTQDTGQVNQQHRKLERLATRTPPINWGWTPKCYWCFLIFFLILLDKYVLFCKLKTNLNVIYVHCNIHSLLMTWSILSVECVLIDWLIDCCLTPTLAVFQLYRGVWNLYEKRWMFCWLKSCFVDTCLL
jgi:hypothetical protein